MVHGNRCTIGFEIPLRELGQTGTLTRAGISLDDRGFDLASGRQLYGNWAGVPYAMTRVGETLRWTLGPAHRSAEQYEARKAEYTEVREQVLSMPPPTSLRIGDSVSAAFDEYMMWEGTVSKARHPRMNQTSTA